MSEYNAQYLNLRRRLSILKLLSESNNTSDNPYRRGKENYIDSLLKELDERYSENRLLNVIESQTETLENSK